MLHTLHITIRYSVQSLQSYLRDLPVGRELGLNCEGCSEVSESIVEIPHICRGRGEKREFETRREGGRGRERERERQ